MSAPASSTTAFTSLVLGRSANAIELLVPPAPAVHDATDLKARCFDFLADLLIEHSSLCSSAELTAAFAHVPNSSFNASLEAADICKTIRSGFFSVHHLVPLGFRNTLGASVSTAIDNDLTKPPAAGLAYFAFHSAIDPTTLDSRISLPSYSFEFWLALPQTLLSSSAPVAVSGTVAKVLQHGTPPAKSRPNAITKSAFTALSDDDKAARGTKTSTDCLSDYEPDSLSLLNPIQLQFIVLCTAATAASPSTALVSPRMASVLASPRASGSSYFGSLDFLDSQSIFDSTVPNPVPLLVTVVFASVSIDSSSLLVGLNQFIDQCKFRLFVPIFRSDYVGTRERNDSASLYATPCPIATLLPAIGST
jgi:hypothetical protein